MRPGRVLLFTSYDDIKTYLACYAIEVPDRGNCACRRTSQKCQSRTFGTSISAARTRAQLHQSIRLRLDKY
jgi:hypothetical protein